MGFNSLVVALLLGLSISETDLVTVSDRGFTLTFTLRRPAPAAVLYGRSPDRLDQRLPLPERTRFHYAAVNGLEPGVTYYYRIAVGSALQPPRFRRPRALTTLKPPPGRKLFTFAVMNDIHVGQDINGLMVPPVPWLPPSTPGFTWRYPVDNYWAFTLRAAVDAANREGVAFTVVNGDLTSWYMPAEFERAKAELDRLSMPYYVTRGNHDRVGEEKRDWFRDVFGLETSWYSLDQGGFHFIFLDDSRVADGWCDVCAEERRWFETDLAGHRPQPTFVFAHHPWGTGGVDQKAAQRMQLLRLLAANPQVAAVINAHSHANRIVTLPAITGELPFIEVSSTTEYPVGYGLVTLYEGGFIYNFEELDCPDCREWNHDTRKGDYGLAPRVLMNDLKDRSYVRAFPPGLAPVVPVP